jgi:hypothetical protein
MMIAYERNTRNGMVVFKLFKFMVILSETNFKQNIVLYRGKVIIAQVYLETICSSKSKALLCSQ